jgi:hypothetical protein
MTLDEVKLLLEENWPQVEDTLRVETLETFTDDLPE